MSGILDKLLFKIKQNSVFSVSFITFSILNLSNYRPTTNVGSNGNFEQWMNLTNDIFTGQSKLIFSYGPLSWLDGGYSTPYNYTTLVMTILFVSLSSALFWSLLLSAQADYIVWTGIALVYFLFFDNIISLPSTIFLLPLAYYINKFSNHTVKKNCSYRVMLLISLYTGFMFYLRFVYGFLSLIVSVGLILLQDRKDRIIANIMRLILTTAAVFTLIGFLLFRNLSTVLTYLEVNYNISNANSIDMSYVTRPTRGAFLDVVIIFSIFVVVLFKKNMKIAIPAILMYLLFFKLGFSRADHYLYYFVLPVAIMSLLVLMLKSRWRVLLFSIICFLLFSLENSGTFAGTPTHNPIKTDTNFSQSYGTRMELLYQNYKLNTNMLNLIGRASIDFYPYNNEYAFANDLNYVHRPLFQNYMTLTPALDSLNVNFLLSSKAPKYILWTSAADCTGSTCSPFEDFDNKYVLNEDPLTTTTILENYHMVASGKGIGESPIILMKRNNVISQILPRRTALKTYYFNKWYSVDTGDDQLQKFSADIESSLIGILRESIYNGPALYVSYLTESGQILTYRQDIENAKSGVWANYIPEKFPLISEKVLAIKIQTTATKYFKTSFKGQWTYYKNIKPDPSLTENQPDLVISRPNVVVTSNSCIGHFDVMNGPFTISNNNNGLTFLHLEGWAAPSKNASFALNKIFLKVKYSDGTSKYFSTTSESRPDVVTAYDRKNLSRSGFSFTILSPLMEQIKSLALIGNDGTSFIDCQNLDIGSEHVDTIFTK